MPWDPDAVWARRARTALPSLVVLAIAVGYLVVTYLPQEPDEPLPGGVSPLVHAAAIALQAVALAMRLRSPIPVFAVATVLDAVVLATSGGELGIGLLAVMIATYTLVRSRDVDGRQVIVGIGALVSAGVGAVAMVVVDSVPLLGIAGLAIVRVVLQFAIPAAVAEVQRGRDELVDALRDRAEMADRERRSRVERELVAQRTGMARELHDIAAHHLSGIIVSAQAASTLVATDPDRTREMLRVLQQDARTTMADLRRTVGLLRSDDLDDDERGAMRSPTLDRVPDLVEEARRHGQDVDLAVEGEARALGPLAETAGYRMVQESLANAARHAPGAPSRVRVVYTSSAVEITVENEASATEPPPRRGSNDRGYGLSGMEERADLVGADLTIGPRPGGGWRNHLTIPFDRDRSPT
jgi:signal transduction histidine kinase